MPSDGWHLQRPRVIRPHLHEVSTTKRTIFLEHADREYRHPASCLWRLGSVYAADKNGDTRDIRSYWLVLYGHGPVRRIVVTTASRRLQSHHHPVGVGDDNNVLLLRSYPANGPLRWRLGRQ